jgi:hypothetical protein
MYIIDPMIETWVRSGAARRSWLIVPMRPEVDPCPFGEEPARARETRNAQDRSSNPVCRSSHAAAIDRMLPAADRRGRRFTRSIEYPCAIALLRSVRST